MSDLDFDQRLERLILDPHSIDRVWLTLTGPLLRLLQVRPRIETKHIEAYVAAMRGDGALPPRSAELWQAAQREFGENLSSLERAQQLYGHVEPRLVNWAVRLKLVLDQAMHVARASEQGSTESDRVRAARRALDKVSHRALGRLEPVNELDPEGGARLDGIESLLDAAQAERDFLGRRRHLLEAARELLLDSAAKVTNSSSVATRLEHVAREIGEIDRLEALGVRSNVGLIHQLDSARAERASQRVNAILSTLESQALMAGDARVAELCQAALAELWQGRDCFSDHHRLSSLAQSGQQTFQPEVLAAARRGFLEAKGAYDAERLDKGRVKYGDYFDRVARSYLSEAPDTELIQSALYVDGSVDVGGVLSPHRVHDLVQTVREVRHPTQQLTLARASAVEDLKDAIIVDPRTVMVDLATDRLLTRRYLGVETREVERRVMASEVRIFLLDGSGSMLGPRARMRDAILVAELSTMIARLGDRDRWLTPTLYYRYFNQELGAVVKVSTASEAIEAVEQVLSRLRHGGTDIQGALLGSFETLREAQQAAQDDLARAQIVLITDGEAAVDEVAVSKARESIGRVPIGVSIIALGEENPALRGLAGRQRERGERVFYQFLNDDVLERLTKGERLSLTLHLPEELTRAAPSQALERVLDEIKAVHRVKDDEALSRVRDEQAALSEVGLALSDLSKSEQARILALTRDAETLEQRFSSWFPLPHSEPVDESAPALRPSETDASAVATVKGLLVAVAEVTELVGSQALQKKADAVELFERLLMEQRLSFVHYRKLALRYPLAFAQELRAIHGVVSQTSTPASEGTGNVAPGTGGR